MKRIEVVNSGSAGREKGPVKMDASSTERKGGWGKKPRWGGIGKKGGNAMPNAHGTMRRGHKNEVSGWGCGA